MKGGEGTNQFVFSEGIIRVWQGPGIVWSCPVRFPFGVKRAYLSGTVLSILLDSKTIPGGFHNLVGLDKDGRVVWIADSIKPNDIIGDIFIREGKIAAYWLSGELSTYDPQTGELLANEFSK